MTYGHPNHYDDNKRWREATPKGYGRQNGKPWTAQQTALILARDPERPQRWLYTIPQLATRIGRTRSAIAAKRSRLVNEEAPY